MGLNATDVSGRVAIFAGPSLPVDTRPDDPRLVWLGPAAAGDAYALARSRPRAVALIDGLFDAWPAIRHRELLDLMAAGVPVIGGASMGALRAAELQPYGMIGVGRIFAAYMDGRLTGDDEVALLHGPEALGWAALTEALVNVRATLQRAVRERVIAAESARAALRVGQALFYKERTWTSLCDSLARSPTHAATALALREWLPAGRVNLKQTDALACVSAALGLCERVVDSPRPSLSLPPRGPFAQALADQVSRGVTGPGRPRAPPPGTALPPPRT
jgi:hypothetical protein